MAAWVVESIPGIRQKDAVRVCTKFIEFDERYVWDWTRDHDTRFQRSGLWSHCTRGVAPGCDEFAPLALKKRAVQGAKSPLFPCHSGLTPEQFRALP